MRLLNTTTLDFKGFLDPQKVRYSILSHCWSQDEADPEVTYRALLDRAYDHEGAGFKKIRQCCDLSRERGFEWTWIDTCCLDKSSSAELTETIDSMFAWYRDSAECYVFLDDCALTLSERSNWGPDDLKAWCAGRKPLETEGERAFINSRWFSRGWTLQELLAPSHVYFYNATNAYLGSKHDLAALVSQASGIGVKYVNMRRPHKLASVAQRMSWASARTTTRPEDVAYSLLGISEVNMPLLYGEGNRAFMRLQEQIILHSDNESILAWGLDHAHGQCTGILADGPVAFRASGNVNVYPRGLSDGWSMTNPRGIDTFEITNRGLAISHYKRPWDRYIRQDKRFLKTIILQCYEDATCVDQEAALLLKLEYHQGLWFRRTIRKRGPEERLPTPSLEWVISRKLRSQRTQLIYAATTATEQFDGIMEDDT